MNRRHGLRTRVLPLVAVLASACGGGGDGGTTGPGKVARVDVTAPSPTMEVGQNMQLSVRYFDSQSAQLTGKAVTWQSSDQSIATVSASGLVAAVAAGNVNVAAVVDGVQGSVAISVIRVPVAFIAITPANPSVRPGETVTLVAQPSDAIGQPLANRPVTWSSANTARATVSQAGVVTGVTSGNVYIRASAEGKTDSVSLRVKNLNAPSISGAPTAELVPGVTATLTGTNFGDGIADNQVYVNGAGATVTAASNSSVAFVVPAATQLPCTATGPAQLMLVANGDTALASAPLRVATARTLAVGASLLLTSETDLLCNEFVGNGGRYLITAFNYANNAGVRTSFSLKGSGQTASGAVASTSITQAVTRGPAVAALAMPDDREAKHLRAHASFMQQDRALTRQLGSPRLGERMRRRGTPGAPAALAVQPPAVGDQLTYRMRRTLNSVTTYDDVTFRVVYSGTKMVILEDGTAPLAGTMDAEYVKLGQEFDQVMYDQLLEFGDPLVVDSALDNNGRMLALFSPRVNNYTVNGISNQLMGFVTLCDFFPRVAITLPDGTTVPACPASNEGEVFYALVPDPSAGWSVSQWRRLIRGTLIHEAKHIASYAWRYYYDASELEETWLEEATAQQASELWARAMYHRGQQQDIRWDEGPNCDYAAESSGCPDPAEGILHHFSFLYTHYASAETKSILDDPFGNIDPVIYGSSWSFIRYVTDVYGVDEPTFLHAIVQVQNDHGVANVASKSGKPFSELMGMWSLASLADNYPGGTVTDPRVRLASWNSRDLFMNMSLFLRGSGNSVIFPLQWPLQTRQVTFGNFGPGSSDVSNLKGGSFVSWELSGTQVGPQALAIRSSTGGAPPPLIGMAIVRIQ